jgi:group I intron endonuclease
MKIGYIYKVTSPSNKSYIGQTRYSIEKRWREHKYDAFDNKKDHCKLLNRAIRKHGFDYFKIECIRECSVLELDELEEHYISSYMTLKPYGYNLKKGGSSSLHTEETKAKIKKTLQGKCKSSKMKKRLSETKKKHIESDLPCYVIHIRKDKEVIGYRISGHPMQNSSEKRFASMSLSLEQKKENALDYLQFLERLIKPLESKIRTLPRYVQKYDNGYCVNYKGTKKYFVSKSKSNVELLNLACKCVQELTLATHLVPGTPSRALSTKG